MIDEHIKKRNAHTFALNHARMHLSGRKQCRKLFFPDTCKSQYFVNMEFTSVGAQRS